MFAHIDDLASRDEFQAFVAPLADAAQFRFDWFGVADQVQVVFVPKEVQGFADAFDDGRRGEVPAHNIHGDMYGVHVWTCPYTKRSSRRMTVGDVMLLTDCAAVVRHDGAQLL